MSFIAPLSNYSDYLLKPSDYFQNNSIPPIMYATASIGARGSMSTSIGPKAHVGTRTLTHTTSSFAKTSSMCLKVSVGNMFAILLPSVVKNWSMLM